MTEILSVPLKKTRFVNVSGPLTNLLNVRCTWQPNTERFAEPIGQLVKLRNDALLQRLDMNETSVELLARYCDQLRVLEVKIRPEDLFIPFAWKDAFYKGSLFTGDMILTVPSLGYERTCSLFNLAALQSQVAASQNFETDQGLRLAARLLQQAARILESLKGAASAICRRVPTLDLQTETLAALSSLMLAQAQEMYVLKAVNERVKDGVVAKLAAQCRHLYAEASKLMQREPLRSLWDPFWLPKIGAKVAAHQALTEFHQSRVCNETTSPGEEIARLQVAQKQFKTAASLSAQGQTSSQKLSGEANRYLRYVEMMNQALTEARKLNDVVYLERVPAPEDLEPVVRVALAKIAPVPEFFSAEFKDLFQDLPPTAVQDVLAVWEIRRMQLINEEIGKLRGATRQLNGILISRNLPAALEESDSDLIPLSLKRKAREVEHIGGIRHIRMQLDELSAISGVNQSTLEDMERLFNDEEADNEKMKIQHQERWITSAQADAVSQDVVSCRQVVLQAAETDKWLRNQCESFIGPVEMLAQLESGLSVPPPNRVEIYSRCSSAAESLRQLMTRVEEIETQRRLMENQLKTTEADITSSLLQVWSTDGAIGEEQRVLTEQLDRIYGSLRQRVVQSIELQDPLISEIQQLSGELESLKISSARQRLFRDLVGTYEAFIQGRENLNEGLDFHARLQRRLLASRGRVSDFCTARRAERDELLKEVESPMNQLSGRFQLLSSMIHSVGEKVSHFDSNTYLTLLNSLERT